MHPLMMNWPENFRDRIKSLGDMFGTGVPTDTRMVQIYTDCFYSISRQMSPPVIHAVSLQQLDWLHIQKQDRQQGCLHSAVTLSPYSGLFNI